MQLTLGMGVAIGAALLHAGTWLHGSVSDTPSLWEFRAAFFGAGALAFLGTVGALRLPHNAGAEVSGPPAQNRSGRGSQLGPHHPRALQDFPFLTFALRHFRVAIRFETVPIE